MSGKERDKRNYDGAFARLREARRKRSEMVFLNKVNWFAGWIHLNFGESSFLNKSAYSFL